MVAMPTGSASEMPVAAAARDASSGGAEREGPDRAVRDGVAAAGAGAADGGSERGHGRPDVDGQASRHAGAGPEG